MSPIIWNTKVNICGRDFPNMAEGLPSLAKSNATPNDVARMPHTSG
jgi:hypothetical protein